MERVQLPGSDILGLSQDLWKSITPDQILAFRDRQYGYGIFDDFKSFGQTAVLASPSGRYASEGNTYRSYEVVGGSFAANITAAASYYTLPTGVNITTPNGSSTLVAAGATIPTPGGITLGANSSQQFDCAILQAGPVGVANNILPFSAIPGTAVQGASTALVNSGDLVFEARFALSTVKSASTNYNDIFLGLCGSGAAQASTNLPLAISSASAYGTTKSMLGFGMLTGGNPGQIDLVYQRVSGTIGVMSNIVTIPTGTGTPTATPGSSGNQLLAGAFLKLGFRYSYSGQNLTPYVNGVAQDGVSGPNKIVKSSVVTAGTPWPNDFMTLCAAVVAELTPFTSALTLDWWACAQNDQSL